ncbi:Site-specific recombinase XerD [Candidatus Frackibacter sp. WG11]|uniref:tyrosine-type recombinase/integrase n=1 Tax=Candidatus Frackibacter sp. WG11 TaxID=2017976 RepID=UPI00088E8BAF|nr:tyrosine-type recombinase/integrase [Candidatus Frackibacter sp. WG11]SDC69277.1 Site-specific recombinase XerD [Candidatus Frackibacter sp. WG11]
MAHLRKLGQKKYKIIIELGRNPATGKRKRKTKTVNGTKKEAQKIMAKLIHEMETGTYVEPSKMTTAELLQKWLKEYCKPNLAPSRYANYREIIERHFIPELGSIQLKNLKPMHIQSYQSKKLTTGRQDGKPGGLSKTTVEKHNRILSQALKYAVKLQIIKSNPADPIKAPSPEEPEIKYLNKEQVNKVLKETKDKWIYNFIYISVNTGMRRGEMLGLRWKDIDLNKKTIQVRQISQRIRNEGIIFKKPKTKSSERLISISNNVVKAIKKIKREQSENKLLLGPNYYTKQNLVFCNEDGSPANPQGVTRRFKRVAKRAGFKDIRLHDLRHTHATLLLQEGVHPKVVQERLGHSSITQTLDTYSHVIPSLQQEAADKLEGLIEEN